MLIYAMLMSGVLDDNHFVDSLINRCSTCSKIKNVVHFVSRFILLLKGRNEATHASNCRGLSSGSGTVAIHRVQSEMFREDYEKMKTIKR